MTGHLPKLCEHCDKEFRKNPRFSARQWAESRFCSHSCFFAHTRIDDQVRFEKFFERRPDGCWWWTGFRHPKGYGAFKLGGRAGTRSHRASWIIYRGEIPSGLHVLHTCDHPECVNPDHLFLGTNVDNVKDKIAKGRQRNLRGSEMPIAKLTEADVLEIRASADTQVSLARVYGVAASTISAIIQRRNWSHI